LKILGKGNNYFALLVTFSPKLRIIVIAMNRSQYNTCVERYADGLFRFALASLRNREDAEDVVQESFTRVWERLDNVEFSRAKSYLFTTAHNAIIDGFRKSPLTTELDNQVQLPDPNTKTPYPDVNEVLHKALGTLPEQQRNAILLRDYEGYSYQEIGDITGMSESQVKISIFRGRTALKKQLKSIDNLIDTES